jgi:hypothetical protein
MPVWRMRTGISISITRSDRNRLKAITKDRNTPQKHVWRAAIVLLSADGVGTNAIMRQSDKSKTCCLALAGALHAGGCRWLSSRRESAVVICGRLRPSCGSGRGRRGQKSTTMPHRYPGPCNVATGRANHRSGLPGRSMTAKRARQLKENCSSGSRVCQLIEIVRMDLLRSEVVFHGLYHGSRNLAKEGKI